MYRHATQPILFSLARAVAISVSDVWLYDGSDSPPPAVAALIEVWGETLAAWLVQFDPTTYRTQTGPPLAQRLEEWALQGVRERGIEETAELLVHGDELLSRAREEHLVWDAELVVVPDYEKWDALAAAWLRRGGRSDPTLREPVAVEGGLPELTGHEKAVLEWIAAPLAAISDISAAPLDEFLLRKIARRSFGATGERVEPLAAEIDARARWVLREFYKN